MSCRVTQRDVAKAAEVSLSTVSLIYSGSPKIPKKTAERVQAIARDLGYRPTPGLSAAQSARWQKGQSSGYSRIAVIRTTDADQRRYYEAIMHGSDRLFERQAATMGYGLETVDLNGMNSSQLRKRLEFLRVDAVLFPMVTRIDEGLMAVICEWPSVGMMTQMREAGLLIVSSDQLIESHMVYEQVTSRGYRRTGIVLTPFPTSLGTMARMGGLLAARERAPVTSTIPILEATIEQTREVARYLQKYNCDSLITDDTGHLTQLYQVWPQAHQLGRAALTLGDGDRYHAGIRNDPTALHDRVLKLIDTMVRGNVSGAQLSQLRQTVRFPWQEGQTLMGPLLGSVP